MARESPMCGDMALSPMCEWSIMGVWSIMGFDNVGHDHGVSIMS